MGVRKTPTLITLYIKKTICANKRSYFIAEPSACPYCAKLDGKVFDVAEMRIGENAPPMHPFCHCTTGAMGDDSKFIEKATNKVYNQGMNSSGSVYGAWNDKNDPYNKERERHAELYYNSVRNRDKNQEIARVAKNSGFSQSDIERIYNHVFIKKHHLEGGYKRFDPNYDMAESWRRLSETGGNNIQKHDLVMLNHELLEQKLMSQGLSYDEAHTETNKKYNYQAAWISWAMKKGEL